MTDSNSLDIRPIQTRIKHEILEEYLQRWGEIILNGLRSSYKQMGSNKQKWVTKFVYVDCFSFQGSYEENGIEVYGSPVIGIRALDNHKESAPTHDRPTPETIVILFEQDRKTFEILKDNLTRLGYGARLRETTDFASLQDGDIAVVHGDYTDHVDSLLEFTGRKYTSSFYLLDPYGYMGMSLDIVARIISQRADVMINFAIFDIYKKTGSVRKGTPEHQRHIEHINAMFGSDSWQRLVEEYDGEELEEQLVMSYCRVLETTDRGLAVKRIPLHFPDRERRMYYLILTTHDGTGGLVMNQILYSARVSEYTQRTQLKRTKEGLQFEMPGVESLEDRARPTIMEVDILVVADEIRQICRGETIAYREVLRRMVNSPYYERDIEKAMYELKDRQLVRFGGRLSNSSAVIFSH